MEESGIGMADFPSPFLKKKQNALLRMRHSNATSLNKKKKISKNNHQIILDESIASPLLIKKIRDVPASLKYETIAKPIINQVLQFIGLSTTK